MMKKKTDYKLVQNKNRTFAIRMNLLYQRVTHPHIFKMCLLASDHPIKTNRGKDKPVRSIYPPQERISE
ncbi:MAG TPA: hypothetical protein DCS83_10045 [Prevotella sp.]|nr:hypothetical protein [Prevotella sp.]